MNKTLAGLILGIGLLSGCSQKEYTQKEIFEKIDKERTFSGEQYKKYSILKLPDERRVMLDQFYDFDKDGEIDVAARFYVLRVTTDEFGEIIECKIKDAAINVGIYNQKAKKYDFFYSDINGDGILDNKEAGKESPLHDEQEEVKELLI